MSLQKITTATQFTKKISFNFIEFFFQVVAVTQIAHLVKFVK